MFVLPPILTDLWNSVSLRFPFLQRFNQLLVRCLSLLSFDAKCLFFCSCSHFIIRRCGEVADMIVDPLVILLPNGHVSLANCLFTRMYILGDWDLWFSIIFSMNSFLRCHYCCEWDIVLVVCSLFLGGAIVEICRFFLLVAQRLAMLAFFLISTSSFQIVELGLSPLVSSHLCG